MPTYRYTCSEGHVDEVWRSIHERSLRVRKCSECGFTSRLTMTAPAIAAAALPNKLHGVSALNDRDKQWDKDLPAYKRMRGNGVQPRAIDGAAEVEQRAGTVTEVEMGHQLINVAKRRGSPIQPQEIRRAQEVSAELQQNDVAKTGAEIGKARREERGAA